MFTYEDRCFPFAIRDRSLDTSEGPGYRYYCIAPMQGAQRDAYLAEMARRVNVSKAKLSNSESLELNISDVKDYDGWSTMLLSYCCYIYDKKNEINTGVLVGKEIIGKWSAPLIDKLQEEANKLSILQNEEDAAKKSSTTDQS